VSMITTTSTRLDICTSITTQPWFTTGDKKTAERFGELNQTVCSDMHAIAILSSQKKMKTQSNQSPKPSPFPRIGGTAPKIEPSLRMPKQQMPTREQDASRSPYRCPKTTQTQTQVPKRSQVSRAKSLPSHNPRERSEGH
jgi:hypothetical protein